MELSYLEKRRLRLQDAFVECLAHKGASWRDRVLAVFDGLTRNLKTPGFRGCAFLMAVAHHGESARVPAAARSYKRFLRDRLRRVLDGEVRDSRELTEQLLLVYEGALTTAVLRPDSDPGARKARCRSSAATPPMCAISPTSGTAARSSTMCATPGTAPNAYS